MRLIGLVLALLTLAPLAAEAQQAGTGYRIGMLETRSTTLNAANIDAFRRGCWNLARDERFRDPARELILLKMDLILEERQRLSPQRACCQPSPSTLIS
jgi:hypothetical protein